MTQLSRILVYSGTILAGLLAFAEPATVAPRHCRGDAKHIHIAVGKDPAREMTISFATKWSYHGIDPPLAGVYIGSKPNQLDRFVEEQEFPLTYNSTLPRKLSGNYYAPFQHHITIDGLEPNTTYYYAVVVNDRSEGKQALRGKPLRDHPSQHSITKEIEAEKGFLTEEELNAQEDNNIRRLSPPPYDGSSKPCVESHRVRSFRTAPVTSTGPVTFAIIGDLGQFDHSKETLEHMKKYRQGIDAVVLVGDIAYTDSDHRRWDTFFDFLDDYSIFSEVPLLIAAGNHGKLCFSCVFFFSFPLFSSWTNCNRSLDIDKMDNGTEIFQSYEARFRMPQVRPAELGTYDGPMGPLNMDAPPYPLPYEWGNAYYSFVYGPSKHIIVCAYSSMEPGSTQYKWIEQELQSVDREVTPWILLYLHVPIYNTFALHPHDLQIFAARQHLEPLMVKYNVNIVFTGHIHAYQRTNNVAMEKIDPKGPIHITVGAGGRQCDAPFKNETAEPWIVHRDASYYGYGAFAIFNQTHAAWKWIPLSPSGKFHMPSEFFRLCKCLTFCRIS